MVCKSFPVIQLVYGVGGPCILASTVASEHMSSVEKLQAILPLVAGGRLIIVLPSQSSLRTEVRSTGMRRT